MQNRALVDFNLLSMNFDLGMTAESKDKFVDLCHLLSYIDEIAKCFLNNVSYQEQILEMRFNEVSDSSSETSKIHEGGQLGSFQGFFHISYAKILMGSQYTGDTYGISYSLFGSINIMLLIIRDLYASDPIEWFSSGLISEEFDAPELLFLRLVMLNHGHITEDQILVMIRSSFESHSQEYDKRVQRIEELVSMTNNSRINEVPF